MCLRCLPCSFLSSFSSFLKRKVLQTCPHWEHSLILRGNYNRNSYLISTFILSFSNKNQIKIIAFYSKVYCQTAWVTLLLLTDWSKSSKVTLKRLWSTSLLWFRTIPAAVQISKMISISYCCHRCSTGRLWTDASSIQHPESWEKRKTQHCFPWGKTALQLHVYQTQANQRQIFKQRSRWLSKLRF